MAIPTAVLARVAALAALAVASACGAAAPAPATVAVGSPSPSPLTASAAPTPSATPVGPPLRVLVIVMENHGYDSVIGLPYIRSLATQTTALTNYHASSHPSLPNYLALTSGSTWGITDDGYHVLPAQGLGDQLSAAAVPWRAYMEGMGANWRADGNGYAVKHDPFAYYGGRCPSAVVPMSDFATDIAGPAPPRFMWITPNLCHDMHDCSPDVGDAWLRGVLPGILAAPAMANGVVFVTWDEDDGGSANHVLTLVLGARTPIDPSGPYSHPSLLATVEDLMAVGRLPATAGVAPIALR